MQKVFGIDLKKSTMPEAISAVVEAWYTAQGVDVPYQHYMPTRLWDMLKTALYETIDVYGDGRSFSSVAGYIGTACGRPGSFGVGNEYLTDLAVDTLGALGISICPTMKDIGAFVIKDDTKLFDDTLYRFNHVEWLLEIPGATYERGLSGVAIPVVFVFQLLDTWEQRSQCK
jgi:hypothetical protein